MKQKLLHSRRTNSRGMSLIEIVVIIVVIGILTSLAMKSMTALMKDARVAETEREMDMLAKAIAGDPSIMCVAGGVRSSFGYVGDIGALPENLEALVTDPGLGTWNGPYLVPSFNRQQDDFKKDGWGVDYVYTGGVTITSTGSGTEIIKRIVDSADDLFLNQVAGIVRDCNDSLPTADDTADIDVEVVIPNGTGSTTKKCYDIDETGHFLLDSIPIGRHLVRAIYTPENDTLIRYATVMPRNGVNDVLPFNFDSSYFSTMESGPSWLTLVEGSQTAYISGGTTCNNIRFDVQNLTGHDIEISSLTLTWSSPEAYYGVLWFNGQVQFDYESPVQPRIASGETLTVFPTEIIVNGATATLDASVFLATQTGNSSKVDMSSVTITAAFSDGSTFDVVISSCE